MNLINFRGLNCHLSAVVSVAHALGINYNNAFCTLWSETDFAADIKYNIYLSKRIIPNLEKAGAKIELLDCASAEKAEQSFSLIQNDELFLIGIDTFYIPWSPFYQFFYEPHYFFAQKENNDSIYCFDPFNDKEMRLMSKDIIPSVFDLSRVRKLNIQSPPFSPGDEAREVLQKHPETQQNLCAEIRKCKNKEYEFITSLIKQVTALINNRYLFMHYLNQFSFAREKQFFDRDFFYKWAAVKNGTYKVYIMRNNEDVIDEVCGLVAGLIRDETGIANEIITACHNSNFET